MSYYLEFALKNGNDIETKEKYLKLIQNNKAEYPHIILNFFKFFYKNPQDIHFSMLKTLLEELPKTILQKTFPLMAYYCLNTDKYHNEKQKIMAQDCSQNIFLNKNQTNHILSSLIFNLCYSNTSQKNLINLQKLFVSEQDEENQNLKKLIFFMEKYLEQKQESYIMIQRISIDSVLNIELDLQFWIQNRKQTSPILNKKNGYQAIFIQNNNFLSKKEIFDFPELLLGVIMNEHLDVYEALILVGCKSIDQLDEDHQLDIFNRFENYQILFNIHNLEQKDKFRILQLLNQMFIGFRGTEMESETSQRPIVLGQIEGPFQQLYFFLQWIAASANDRPIVVSNYAKKHFQHIIVKYQTKSVDYMFNDLIEWSEQEGNHDFIHI